MRFQQHLGIVGAICSSLLVSYGAYAQTTNPTPSGTNQADMERICAEYMNANGNSGLMQNNRTPASTPSTDAVRAAQGTTGTNRSSNPSGTSNPGSTASGTNRTGGMTTNRNTATRSGNSVTGTTGTTTNREATNRTGGTTGNTATRQGVGSFTAEELDRMCANFINNSDSDRPTPSATPGGSTRPTQPRTAPTNR